MATKKSEKKSTKKKVSEEKVLSDIFAKLMELTGLKSPFEVSVDKDNEAMLININSDEETGLIIGAHGKTLSSIQTLVGLMFKNETGEWKRIVVNVSDYREKEESRLVRLAEDTARRAIESGSMQNLYNLSPSQRRIVHMTLSENSDVITESQGEGSERYLSVSPKK